ncbi:MAG: hypothetical protein WBE12_15470 [Candidatus Acidiferrum sp.]
MRTFEVFLNEKRLCIAGIDGDCVLSAIVNYVSIKRARSNLTVGGLNTVKDEHVRWVNRHLRVGDEIRIRIAKRSWADRPVERFPRDRSKEVESMKRYVREYAKQLGWEIKEST